MLMLIALSSFKVGIFDHTYMVQFYIPSKRKSIKKNMVDKSTTKKANSINIIHKVPFFYGWVIMAVGTLGLIMTSPGQTYTESIFIEYLIEDLNLSRSLISSLYSFGTLVGGFSLPLWGKQIDRKGPRLMITLVSILFGFSLIYMGFVQTSWMIGIGFILIRMLGQGSLGLISQTAINQWWSRKRGMIMGISGLLMSLIGMGTFPNLVHGLIASVDWRNTYIILGSSLLLLMAPLGYIFIRNKPEDYGLNPDGEKSQDLEKDHLVNHDEMSQANWTLKEAFRTYAFWILAASLSLFTLLITGITFHLVSIFQSHGLDAATAARIFLPLSITGALVNLLVGYLSDHLELRFLLAFGLLLLGISLILVLTLQGTGSALAFGIVLGSANGFIRTISTVSWPKFFGREHLGSIFGFTSALSIIGAALGPLPFGYVFDWVGSYNPVLIVFSAICLLLAMLSLRVKKPQKQFAE
jgi:sugar phosphate permease